MGKWINIDDLPSDRVEWDDILDAPSIDLVRGKPVVGYEGYYEVELCDYFEPMKGADDGTR